MTKKLLLLVVLLFVGIPVLAQVDNAFVRRYTGPGNFGDPAGNINTNNAKEGRLRPVENLKGRSAEDFLTPDGRIDLKAIRESGYQGPLDLKGLDVVTDPHTGEPVLSPNANAKFTGSPDDTFWCPLGSGMNAGVWSLAVYENKLIAGGNFYTAGGVSANHIASWDGSSWSPLGSGVSDWVFALTVYNNKLIAGGVFTTAGGVSANYIASWDGSSWSALGSGMSDGGVYALAVYDNKLIAGGGFTNGWGPSSYIASWDGSSWSPLGVGLYGYVDALAVYHNKLFAGGAFSRTWPSGSWIGYIAVFNDTSTWYPLGSGMNGRVYALTVYGNKLIAGGEFTTAGYVSANYIASWDGSSWSTLGSGMNDFVYALAVYDNKLIAGGRFTTAGGVSANRIASLDGSSWSPMGVGMSRRVLALTIYDNKLIAGGEFDTAGGKVVEYIAQWAKPYIHAKFIASNRCGSPPLTVTFNDSSTSTYPIIAWHWDFGDGDTSNQQNPTHQYTNSGVFDVTLIAYDSIGADTLTKQDYITVQDSVSADFFGLPNSGISPLTVMFEPILSGIANLYFWDFGDGDTSSLRNPIHIYTSQGKYDVKLKVGLELDDCNQVDSMIREDYVFVHDLKAQFSANPTAGIKPLMVQFTDSSSGSPSSWFWDFGDGNTSLTQNPQHQYDTAGVYDVFLRVCNFIGCDSLLKMNYILVDTRYTDLFGEIYGYGFFGPRPGFDYGFYCVWTNVGTIPAENCTLKILFPSQMTFYDIAAVYTRTGTYAGYTFSGDTIIVPLTTINPSYWYGGYVWAYGNIPSSVPIGDTLICQSWLTSSTLDQNYGNNHVLFRQVVVGSWDPNDKLASPEGEGTSHTIPSNQRLTYTIQFENKPEATADVIYLRVVDTLDQDLDWGTLAIGAMSHPDKCGYEFDPYTGEIVWFCDSIMLPPNHNPPEGEGFFTFSISPKPDLPEGQQIANTAWIRFDYNPWLQAPEEGPVIRTIKYPFIRGDVNGSGVIELGDVVYLITYLYKNGPAPNPLLAGDANCSGEVELGDVVYLISYLYKGGLAPCK